MSTFPAPVAKDQIIGGELPIHAFRSEIVEAVRNNSVVIIQAETGAGKSTQVPRYLIEDGYEVVVTEPRRMAARTLAERVSVEVKQPLGQLIGFKLGGGTEETSKNTRCTFATDGLQLVRELTNNGRTQVLVIDEVHEWNRNVEVLLAWSRLQQKQGIDIKLVIMSATLDAQPLSDFFGGAPIINVPGRMFPVIEEDSAADILNDVVRLARSGRNVLVFQPGKAEIKDMIDALTALNLNAEILPLHGALSTEDQKKCFANYRRPKVVVATNVAQTSITIDDIDAVVDSGMERRIELSFGVEGLFLRPISLADRKQRMGRAGRTKPGIYIDHCEQRKEDRQQFPTSEIERTSLDQTVLRLAIAGFDMEVLEFFHQPAIEEIKNAKRKLRLLGLFDAEDRVTGIGKKVSKMPVSVTNGRMIIEANKLSVVDDVLTIAAILEQGGISWRGGPWRTLVMGERNSDVMAQLALYKQASNMSYQAMVNNGINAKAFHNARKNRGNLYRALRGKVVEGSTGHREHILQAVCAGMVDHIYQNQDQRYSNGVSDPFPREIGKESVVSEGKWVIGLPFDLEIKLRRTDGTRILRLLNMVSVIPPEMLVFVAPQLITTQKGQNPYYSAGLDQVMSFTQTWFNGQLILTKEVPHSDHPDAEEILIRGRNKAQLTAFKQHVALKPWPSPDPLGDKPFPAEVYSHQYGTHAGNGTPLMIYAAVKAVNSWRGGLSDFVWDWTTDRKLAEQHHSAARFPFNSQRSAHKAQMARDEAKDAVNAAWDEAEKLLSNTPAKGCRTERKALQRLLDTFGGQTTEHMLDWTNRTNQAILELRTKLAGTQKTDTPSALTAEVAPSGDDDLSAALKGLAQQFNEHR